MASVSTVCFTTYTETRNIPYHTCTVNQTQYHLDLFIPIDSSRGSRDSELCVSQQSRTKHYVKQEPTQHKSSSAPLPPIVVFVHGGGWQRGDRLAWVYYLKTSNLLVAFITWVMGLYRNVGAALASRGVACAVISYPLAVLDTPGYLLDMFLSHSCSLVFSGLLYTSGSLLISLGLSAWSNTHFSSPSSIIQTMTSPLRSNTYVLERNGDVIVWIIEGVISHVPCVTAWLIFNNILTLSAMLMLSSPRLGFSLLFVSLVIVYLGLKEDLFVCLVISATLITVQLVRYNRTCTVSYIDQTQAVEGAISWIKECGKNNGFDPSALVLMGHSAGGHLASLAAMDTSRHAQTGAKYRDIKGVISISGVYDLLKLSKPITRYLHLHPAFGPLPSTWSRASPIRSPARADNPPFLLINAQFDWHLNKDAEEFYTELKTKKTDVTRHVIQSTTHFTIIAKFSNAAGCKLSEICADFVKDKCVTRLNTKNK